MKKNINTNEEHACKGGINIPDQEHITDGTPCWCNPKIIKCETLADRLQGSGEVW